MLNLSFWHEKYEDKVILRKSLLLLGGGALCGLIVLPLLLWTQGIPISVVSLLSGGLLGMTAGLIVLMILL